MIIIIILFQIFFFKVSHVVTFFILGFFFKLINIEKKIMGNKDGSISVYSYELCLISSHDFSKRKKKTKI